MSARMTISRTSMILARLGAIGLSHYSARVIWTRAFAPVSSSEAFQKVSIQKVYKVGGYGIVVW
jgi:hypothetical protein